MKFVKKNLRSCPFCGSMTPEMYERNMTIWWVHCYRCGTEGSIGRDVETAKRMWNEAGRSRAICWYCGGDLIWDSDTDLEDGPGIESFLHCKDCGADVQYTKREEEE